MIKWIDEVDSKIDAVNKRVDNIVAEEVDAKNLSEVLENLDPITKTTDLTNNKVKLGMDMDKAVTVSNPITKNINSTTGACELAMNIDSDTLEVTEGGALKVKSAGGSGKYLHIIRLSYFHSYITTHLVFSIVNDSSSSLTLSDLFTYLYSTNAVNYYFQFSGYCEYGNTAGSELEYIIAPRLVFYTRSSNKITMLLGKTYAQIDNNTIKFKSGYYDFAQEDITSTTSLSTFSDTVVEL